MNLLVQYRRITVQSLSGDHAPFVFNRIHYFHITLFFFFLHFIAFLFAFNILVISKDVIQHVRLIAILVV